MTDKHVTAVHLVRDEEHQKLGIRLVNVSVDEIAGAGGRAIFELYRAGDEGGEQPYLTIVQEAPTFRAALAGRVPDPDSATPAILAEATGRLRANLLDLIEALGKMR